MNDPMKHKALAGSLLTLLLGAGAYFVFTDRTPAGPDPDSVADGGQRIRQPVADEPPERDRIRVKPPRDTRPVSLVRPVADKPKHPIRVHDKKKDRKKKKAPTPAC